MKQNSTNYTINLNEPKYIPKLIDWAETQGWAGSQKITPLNGLLFLQLLGYDTLPIETQN